MRINYDNTIPEMEEGFTAFWRKYSLKRTILLSVAYLIGIGLFVNMALTGGMPLVGGIGGGLTGGILISLWLKPRRARKKIIMTVEKMYEEKYSVFFGADSIEIETLICSEDSEPVAEKSQYMIASEQLYSKETGNLFLLFVNRGLIHVFPKRCMEEQEIEKLRNYFIEKRI